MLKINLNYTIKEDIDFIIEAEKINYLKLAESTGVSRTTLMNISKTGVAREDVCEKFYTYAYNNEYRINTVKEELLKERHKDILFHGSKSGLNKVISGGSRENCDFGKGFYLGETYNQALSFVCEDRKSSIYSFKYSLKDLKVKKFNCDFDWMLAICFFRGKISDYSSHPSVKKVVKAVESADVVVAPIADNKMFYIMSQFTDGEINKDVALHSLAASGLGLQYNFRTEKALKKLKPIEKYYLSTPERDECKEMLKTRGFEIDTKLKLAKREYKNGLYIEELLK